MFVLLLFCCVFVVLVLVFVFFVLVEDWFDIDWFCV